MLYENTRDQCCCYYDLFIVSHQLNIYFGGIICTLTPVSDLLYNSCVYSELCLKALKKLEMLQKKLLFVSTSTQCSLN